MEILFCNRRLDSFVTLVIVQITIIQVATATATTTATNRTSTDIIVNVDICVIYFRLFTRHWCGIQSGRRYGPAAMSESKSLPSYWLTPIDFGSIIGISMSERYHQVWCAQSAYARLFEIIGHNNTFVY
jgi:hypothetical protein